MSENTPGRPEHHLELLAALEFATEIATLYGHVATLAADMCRSCGIEDADLVIAVVQEQARRRVRKRLTKFVKESGLLENLQEAIDRLPPDPPNPIVEVFPGLAPNATRKRRRNG